MMARFRNTLLTTTALMPLGILAAAANPLGSQVVGGMANVQGQGTSSVTVTQSTDKAIINWQTFNIGTGETTRFVQPGSSSVTLNRVTGSLGPSFLDGTLTANGRVFLVNPDGVLFGANSKVNTGSFLATTNDIRNADFMAGRYQFNIPGRPDASIVNLGTITAQNGGFAALVAPGVRNTGTITANLGAIGLAAGNSFSLDFYGDRLITLGVNDSIAAKVIDVATGQPLNALVQNDGKLKANGGRVELTAAAARQVVDSVINNTGVIEANSIGSKNGMIVLGTATAATKPAGAPAQTIKLSGTISAAGKRKNTKGGTIVVSGENIQLSSATIDASGRAGGGKVLIGGDVGGGKGNAAVATIPMAALESFTVATASTVSVDAATTINASAIANGDGGKVVVWSDQATTFYGTIKAQGGTQFGNGGFVETSGHQTLSFNGVVDTSAPHGINGTLLLDPQDALITTNAGAGIVTVASIQAALLNGDVIVTTGTTGTDQGNITVAANIGWVNANALTLSAYKDIVVNANIVNTGGATINLRADNGGTGVGTVSFGSGAAISASGVVSIFYNPGVNPADSVVNNSSYVNPTENFAGNVIGGTLATYMLVNSVYDLQNIQNNLSGSFALGKNIDASTTINWNGGVGFLPIGDSGNNKFAGTLNGIGYTIDRLAINSVETGFNPGVNTIGLPYVGLFGGIATSGLVENVGLTNVNIAGNNQSGGIGALASWNFGKIENVYVTGSITGSGSYTGLTSIGGLVTGNVGTIENSYSSATITTSNGQFGAVGGLVGGNYGTIFQSYATGSVSVLNGSSGSAGGLVGTNETGFGRSGTISQSYATGAVSGSGWLGGLVGTNTGVIDQSYATGAVSGSGSIGGLVGTQFAPDLTVANQISDSYAVGPVGGSGHVGGLVGQYGGVGPWAGGIHFLNNYWDLQSTNQASDSLPFGATGLTTAQFTSGLPSGFNPAAWGRNPSLNNGYPYLLWQVVNSTPSSPTILRPLAGLILITVTVDPETKLYGNADPILTYQITSGSLSGSDAFTGSLTRVAGQNVGTYPILEGSLGLPANYSLTFLSSTLMIQPRPITVTAATESKTFGTPNPNLAFASVGLLVGDTLTGSLATTATINSAAGTYPITQGTLANPNYAINYVGANLTVTGAANSTPITTSTQLLANLFALAPNTSPYFKNLTQVTSNAEIHPKDNIISNLDGFVQAINNGGNPNSQLAVGPMFALQASPYLQAGDKVGTRNTVADYKDLKQEVGTILLAATVAGSFATGAGTLSGGPVAGVASGGTTFVGTVAVFSIANDVKSFIDGSADLRKGDLGGAASNYAGMGGPIAKFSTDYFLGLFFHYQVQGTGQ